VNEPWKFDLMDMKMQASASTSASASVSTSVSTLSLLAIFITVVHLPNIYFALVDDPCAAKVNHESRWRIDSMFFSGWVSLAIIVALSQQYARAFTLLVKSIVLLFSLFVIYDIDVAAQHCRHTGFMVVAYVTHMGVLFTVAAIMLS
jgi:uncharacterized membrane protein YobD (UPF0266 family)